MPDANQIHNKLIANLDSLEKQELSALAEKIKAGKVVLFLGAAVHCSPPEEYRFLYAQDCRPPLGGELATKLAEALEYTIREEMALDWPKEEFENNVNSLIQRVDELGNNINTAQPTPLSQELELFKEGILDLKNNVLDKWRNRKIYGLSWIAQYYERVNDRSGLVNHIAAELQDKKPSPLVKALAEMNFNYIITTNYDNLYETALEKLGKPYEKGVYKPNTHKAEVTVDRTGTKENQSTFIYKIHGDIKEAYANGTYQAEKDALVITDEDYIHFILRMGEKNNLDNKNNYNPVPSSFYKILVDPTDITILFIGYSLMDYNLRLLFKSAMFKKNVILKNPPKRWSIDINPDANVKKIFEGNYSITFIEQNAWSVIPFLYKKIFDRPIPFL